MAWSSPRECSRWNVTWRLCMRRRTTGRPRKRISVRTVDGKFSENPHYRRYEELLIDLHRLFQEGKEDSPEADALREQMDVDGSWLSPEEADRVGGLSGDLYQVGNQEIYSVLSEAGLQTWMDLLATELQAGKWDAVLDRLRIRPASIPGSFVARTRAVAYHQLGHAEAALEFARWAADAEGEDGFARFLVVELLDKLGRGNEALDLVQAWSATNPSDAWWLIKSVGIALVREGAAVPWSHLRTELVKLTSHPDALLMEAPQVGFYALFVLAVSHLALDEWAAAEEQWRNLTQIQPQRSDCETSLFELKHAISCVRSMGFGRLHWKSTPAFLQSIEPHERECVARAA